LTGIRSSEIQILPATPDDAGEIADLYLASRADALSELHRLHTDDEVRTWISGTMLRCCQVWVAGRNGGIVGFLALNGDVIDQLYVLPGHYRQGIGSQLLAVAKQNCARLRLFTFQRNVRARAFYQAHGFRLFDLNDGSRNAEQEPDAQYIWSSGAGPS
jgi:GNAT superfamily N-acetyltransferase